MNPSAVDFASDLWRMIEGTSPFATALLFYLWRLEREERRACQAAREEDSRIFQKAKEDVTERAINGLHAATVAVQRLTDILSARKGGAS